MALWASMELGNRRVRSAGAVHVGASGSAWSHQSQPGVGQVERGSAVAAVGVFVLVVAGIAFLSLTGFAVVVIGVRQEERRATLPVGSRPLTGSALMARRVLGTHFTFTPEVVCSRARPGPAAPARPDVLVGS